MWAEGEFLTCHSSVIAAQGQHTRPSNNNNNNNNIVVVGITIATHENGAN